MISNSTCKILKLLFNVHGLHKSLLKISYVFVLVCYQYLVNRDVVI